MRKKGVWIPLAMAFFFCFGSFLAFGEQGQKSMEVRVTGHMPVGHQNTVANQRWMKEVENKSNGKFKFVYYPAGQLAIDMKAIEMCRRGAIEMAEIFEGRAVGLVPEVNLAVPYFDDPDWFARRFYDPSSGGGFFYKYYRPAFAKYGLHIMMVALNTAEYSIITKKPVDKMADYQGMKLRSPGRANGIVLESWGAKAVVMPSSDVYMALQRGTVDGANSGITTFRSRKWYEVASYIQMLWEQVTKMDMVVNLKWWNSLSPDDRTLIEESMRSSALWSWEQGIQEIEGDVKFMKVKGLTVVDFRKSKPEEWEKMRTTALAALEEQIKPSVGEAAWKEHVSMLNATKSGTKTWKDVIKTMKW